MLQSTPITSFDQVNDLMRQLPLLNAHPRGEESEEAPSGGVFYWSADSYRVAESGPQSGLCSSKIYPFRSLIILSAA